jgi:hypothetical protein
MHFAPCALHGNLEVRHETCFYIHIGYIILRRQFFCAKRLVLAKSTAAGNTLRDVHVIDQNTAIAVFWYRHKIRGDWEALF